MGILDIAEDAAGAFAADKALEAVDPNAGILAKGAAAIAGVVGAGEIRNLVGGLGGGDQAQASADQPAQDDSGN